MMTPRAPRAAWMVAAAVLLAAAPAVPPPSDLHGPLSDFWARVKADWSRRIGSLNQGSLQTAMWVTMVWDGPDAVAVDDLAKKLQERENRRWVRAQITRDRYRDLSRRDLAGMQAFRQSLIVLGSPADNPLVEKALAPTPLRVGPGFVTAGRRRMTGDGLVLIALAANPIHKGRYALVITGSSAQALPGAAEVPYGESDYVVYRGRKLLDRGFFRWKDDAPTGEIASQQSFPDHAGWRMLESSRYRIHFDPGAAPASEVASLGRKLDAEMAGIAAFYALGQTGVGGNRIDLYLYASIDEKVSQVSDQRLAHYDPADDSLHVVWSPRPGGVDGWDPSLAARVMLRRASGVWGQDGERELPGLAWAVSLACNDRFQTIPLAEWAARSTRDVGWLPMDVLLSRPVSVLESDDLTPLDAAAFVRDLMLKEGAGKMSLFYRTARRSDFHDRFKEIFGLSIHQAETRWRSQQPAGNPHGQGPRSAATLETGEGRGDIGPALEALRRRDYATAERLARGIDQTGASLSLLSRVYFSEGRFPLAITAATSALTTEGFDAEDRAWASLTRGRARAMMGWTVAAAADLRSHDIQEGPAPIRVIADFWLEHLGQSLNGHAVNQLLMQQASGDLMNFDWDAAEAKLRAVLTSDPQSREAHATLGQVYLSKYQYWYDWGLLDLELHPGDSMTDPDIYKYLADKGRRELRMAESLLPDGEDDRWMSEAGPVDPAAEQPMAHLLIGKAHLVRGDYEAARSEVQTALSLEPRSDMVVAFCHLYLARIAAGMKDAATARSEYEAVLKLSVGGDVTKLAKEEMQKIGGAP